MQFTFLSFATVFAVAASTSAKPVVPREILDVWAPTIISPNSTTVWTLGQQYNVTWNTSNAPSEISNGAAVVLGENGTLTDDVLAEGFDLRQGWVTVTVPTNLTAGPNYSIILFGDSGDESEPFSIIDASV